MLDRFTDQVNKVKKVRGEIIMTGKRFLTFPLTRTTEMMQFTDPALTTSSGRGRRKRRLRWEIKLF